MVDFWAPNSDPRLLKDRALRKSPEDMRIPPEDMDKLDIIFDFAKIINGSNKTSPGMISGYSFKKKKLKQIFSKLSCITQVTVGMLG